MAKAELVVALPVVPEVAVVAMLQRLLEESARRLARWRNLETGRQGGPSLGLRQLEVRVAALTDAYDVARDAAAVVLSDGAACLFTSHEIVVTAEAVAAHQEELAARLAERLGVDVVGLLAALERVNLELVERVPPVGAQA